MKPPTTDAIDVSLQLLMDDFNKKVLVENPCVLAAPAPSCYGPLIPLDRNQDSSSSGSSLLDSEIAAIENALELLQQKADGMLADLRHDRNAELSRIHRLPDDLIIETFLHLRDKTLFHKDFEQLHTLAQVCQRWHSVVLQTARLWNRITSLYDTRIVQIFLKRSGAEPLTIKLCQKKLPDDDCKEFLMATASSARRWKTVQWRRGSGEYSLGKLGKLPASVQELDVKTISSSKAENQWLDFADENSTPFKHVTAHGVSLYWSSPRLSNLSTLNLARVSLSSKRALSLIAASPSLRTLSLHDLTVPRRSHQDATTSPSYKDIHLPLLSQLILQGAGYEITSLIVRLLHIPNARHIYIDEIPGDDVFPDMEGGLLHSAKRLIGEARMLKMSAETGRSMSGRLWSRMTLGTIGKHAQEGWSCELGAIGVYLAFDTDVDNKMQHLKDLSYFVSASSPKLPVSLKIGSRDFHQSFPTLSIPKRVLQNLPGVYKINIQYHIDATALVKALFRKDELLPNLFRLDVSAFEDSKYRLLGSLERPDMARLVERRGGRVGHGIWETSRD